MYWGNEDVYQKSNKIPIVFKFYVYLHEIAPEIIQSKVVNANLFWPILAY